ncbi:MAG: FxsA family protein [Deltaproteobacteria bacterium]|nr:FxsA family protein [Deltaproteobacteria bacterium]
MFARIVLIFVLFPLFELYVLVQVGSVIGAGTTILLVLLTAVAGAWLAREQGLRAMVRIQSSLQQGIVPADDLLDGAMILVAGVVLLTPGFISDVLGLMVLVPPIRNLIRTRLRSWATAKAATGQGIQIIHIDHDRRDR